MTNFSRPIASLEPVAAAASPLRIALLGASGSIGRQTIDMAKRNPERFRIVALSVNKSVDFALEACADLHPRYLAVCDSESAAKARQKLSSVSPQTTLVDGDDAMSHIVTDADIDMVVTATVGYSGLLPTLAAISANKDIALANKETLVVAGEYIRGMMATSKSRIFPIDSEHSAIAQCLQGERLDTVRNLIITASGGPFRTLPKEMLSSVTAKDALKHPNWNMGAKITIDSASMMNKAFEIIEAHFLFGINPENILPVVHPQSIVHSMVEFEDGAIKAQLGVPDMHLPIAYALGMNTRVAGASNPLSLSQIATLTFEKPDEVKFPCLTLARLALSRKGNSACVINAANEIAVDAFLHNRIRFNDIYNYIIETVNAVPFIENPSPDDFISTNSLSRRIATDLIDKGMRHD